MAYAGPSVALQPQVWCRTARMEKKHLMLAFMLTQTARGRGSSATCAEGLLFTTVAAATSVVAAGVRARVRVGGGSAPGEALERSAGFSARTHAHIEPQP